MVTYYVMKRATMCSTIVRQYFDAKIILSANSYERFCVAVHLKEMKISMSVSNFSRSWSLKN